MAVPQVVKRFTPAEYYALERDADYKSDFYNGEIFAMSGGSARHSRITANLLREVGTRLKGSECVEYESNLRAKVRATGLRTYPDASVYCGPVQFDEEDTDGETATNPAVLFEVLSRFTEAYDRGFKAANYRKIDTLKAYVLVAQDAAYVEVYHRQAGGAWTLHEADGLDATLNLPGIGVSIPLRDVYDRVTLSPAPSPRPGGGDEE